jgi:type I restriction enzyme R subunit
VFEDKKNGLIVDFIGIAGFLATATKKYSGGGGKGKPTIDLEEAIALCFEQLAATKALMGNFELAIINGMSALDRVKWSKGLFDDLLKSDEVTDAFLKEERKLTELVSMTSSDERIWTIFEEVAVVQKFREMIRKVK